MAKIRVIIRKFHAKYDEGVSDDDLLDWKRCEQYCQLHEFCTESILFDATFSKLCPGSLKYIIDFTVLEVIRND